MTQRNGKSRRFGNFLNIFIKIKMLYILQTLPGITLEQNKYLKTKKFLNLQAKH